MKPTMKPTMKAVGYTVPGPIGRAEALIDLRLERPSATGHDLLVQVGAVSVNPVDFKIRASRAPASGLPAVLGWDAAGKVVEIGDRVTRFKVGDAVWYAGALDRPWTTSSPRSTPARSMRSRGRRSSPSSTP